MAKKIFIGIISCFIALGLWVKVGDNQKVVEKTTQTDQIKEPVQSTAKSDETYPGNATDWDLILVNKDNKIEKEPTNLKELPNGEKIDSRIFGTFNAMVNAADKKGFKIVTISGYRSVAEQRAIVERDIASYKAQGFSDEEAKKKAMEYLTEPGLSEHHTGLAIDILDQDWYNKGNMLEGEFGDTDAGKWIEENACQYGFIVRYEKGKESITGINYEPWHIRYVGKANALYMKKHNLSLEEYVEMIKK
ncbi:D-alanyl-D-alanine carboxypeptidase family protein [Melissococcus sp. OM08-11BH]|uniref:M15 family metallopeptidase n=1 Tax=Melissococcus sp. OM08-11BH TaxID=2293110 RepID=UPI000E5088AB|nr:M15 family metallopeptidase [Melissococcus sp. OM08-11BH]RGI32226.1 D-alanyl-D-alanine carboxypeptidase family protein [Melissococcus sp. OM08-11BH]